MPQTAFITYSLTGVASATPAFVEGTAIPALRRPRAPRAPRATRAVPEADTADMPVADFTPPPPREPGAPIPAWAPVTEEDKTKLVHTMGIELTMMPPMLSKNPNTHDGRIVTGLAAVIEGLMDRDAKGLQARDAHKDGFAVEVPSKPMKTFGEIKRFYDYVSRTMRAVGLTPHHAHITSGGGHIHMGSVSLPVMINALRDIQNKPWLAWVFNEPDDSNSANSYTEDLEALDAKLKVAARTINCDPTLFNDGEVSDDAACALTFYGDLKYASLGYLPDDKGEVARYCQRYKTLELRFFEAPADWDEQEAHVRFADAYMRWVARTYKVAHCVVVVDTEAKLKAFTLTQCTDLFREFLNELGLPSAPYERMVTENLGYRFKKGKRV